MELETEEVLTLETWPLTFVTSTVLVVEVVVDVVVVVVFEVLNCQVVFAKRVLVGVEEIFVMAD